MKIIEIALCELIDLSENITIELGCEICGFRTIHKPVRCVKIPDYRDAYIVACEKCGHTIIAEWRGLDEIGGPDVMMDACPKCNSELEIKGQMRICKACGYELKLRLRSVPEKF